MQNTEPNKLETIASLCKRRGFIFQSSEIYDGISGFWDYGPLGCELKRNIKESWWRQTVRLREDVVGLEATIIMHPAIWKASGHLDTFSDPMSMCRDCKKLLRSDQAWDIFADGPTGAAMAELCAGGAPDAGRVAAWIKGRGKGVAPNLAAVKAPDACIPRLADALPSVASPRDLYTLLATPADADAPTRACPHCGGDMTEPRPFNLMFKTIVGPIEDPANVAYLRPETAQAIFAQFPNVYATARQTVPFGIAQMGKAFRNEVTPRNYTFRSREFEQMELEFFIKPDEAVELLCGRVVTLADNPDLATISEAWGWEVWHKYWVEQRKAWIVAAGLPADSFVEYWQKPDELAHYARACVDIEYAFPFGTQELEGIAARSDFDLSQHQQHSGQSMEVFDEALKLAANTLDADARAAFTEKVVAAWTARGKSADAARAFVARLFEGKYIPHVIEPSAGVDRMALALLCNAYAEETVTDDKGKSDVRTLLRFAPNIAPIKVAVFPLVKNKPELVAKAREIFGLFQRRWNCFWDASGAIGRRYRRMDEAGTPFCVTVDFQTLDDGTVTLRDRDTMKQERLTVAALKEKLDTILD
jgi:glycyl-tRNA synthetase